MTDNVYVSVWGGGGESQSYCVGKEAVEPCCSSSAVKAVSVTFNIRQCFILSWFCETLPYVILNSL